VQYSFLYVVVRFLLETLIVRNRSEARLRAEVLALRHQLAVLERQVGRPRWHPTDRLVLAALSRVMPRQDWRSLLPRPETLLRWHRELVRRKWAAYRRRPGRQRPVVWSELHVCG
jgi:putative transposase